jgi:hypothetical protein
MHEDYIEKTALNTGDGHFEFLRLLFGLKYAPAEFSRIMKMIFGSTSFVEVYLDDITVHSASFDDHLTHLRIVFDKLKSHSLKTNWEKSFWIKNKIKLLGHIILGREIKMEPDKIVAIKEWKCPTKVSHVQQFMGICGDYRTFIRDFAKIVAPLYKLLKKDVKLQ